MTKTDYHVIIFGDGSNYGADLSKKPVSIVDLALMAHLRDPAFGYLTAKSSDSTRFNQLISDTQLTQLTNLLLQRY